MRQRRIGARIGFGVRVVRQLTEPWLHPPAAAGQGSWRYFTFGDGDGLRPGAGLGLSAG
jgi:hypothetical protein